MNRQSEHARIAHARQQCNPCIWCMHHTRATAVQQQSNAACSMYLEHDTRAQANANLDPLILSEHAIVDEDRVKACPDCAVQQDGRHGAVNATRDCANDLPLLTDCAADAQDGLCIGREVGGAGATI